MRKLKKECLKEKPKLYRHKVENKNIRNVSYFKLQYHFVGRTDIILIIMAFIGSLIAGTSMPFIALLLGKVINNFGSDILNIGEGARLSLLKKNLIKKWKNLQSLGID